MISTDNLAPVVLFVYKRLYHAQQTVKFLQKNDLAEQSELYIYSDGPKHEHDIEKVKEVRAYLKTISGFKTITVIEREKNLGLANSIITGVTEVIDKFGKVIVMEDDLLCSRNFLSFMNKALDHYKDDKRIFSVTGLNYPIKIPESYKHDVYLAYRESSWGWGTWKDRWDKTDWQVEVIKSYKDHRGRYIVLERHSGAQAARNRGIKAAKGNWIAFQDSDDEWRQDKLEKQIRALADVNFDPWTVVHTNCMRLETSTGKLAPMELPEIEGINVYSILLRNNGPMFPGILVSRQALQKINYLDENVPSYQEWDTAIRLAKYCRFIHLKEPLFTYKLHEGETISKNGRRDIMGYQYILDKFKDEIITKCGEDIWRGHLKVQLHKCLEYGLWKDADFYFKQLFLNARSSLKLRLCRRFHVRPSKVERLLSISKRVVMRVLRLLSVNPSFASKMQKSLIIKLKRFSDDEHNSY
ncbi:MAG: glycosyltransferase [Actinomycetota bacterium]|nr:glycosyltransferase [Actinomycetota bacterium]